jgi:hypothetical protein
MSCCEPLNAGQSASGAAFAASLAAETAARIAADNGLAADIAALDAAIADISSRTLNDVIGELNFSGMANVTLGNGARSFTCTNGVVLAGTIINAGAAATLDVLNATGLRFNANATNSQYTSAAQTASAWELPIDTLYTAFGIDETLDLIVQAYYSTLTIPTAQAAPAGIGIGIRGAGTVPSNSIARFRGIKRSNSGGTQIISSTGDATGDSAYTTAPAGTTNVLGFKNNGAALTMMAGTWGGGWAMGTTPMICEANSRTAVSTTNSGFKDRNNIFAFYFATGNTGADTVVVLQRMLFRAR